MNQVFHILFTFLFLAAVSIASVGYLWHLVKPTVERAELQYIKDINATNPSVE